MRFVLPSALILLAVTGPGCGKKGFGGLVSGAQFQAVEENGELYGDLKVLLNTGTLLFPSFDLPILNPRVPGSQIGAIGLRDALGLGTELNIRVHLNEIAGVDSLDGSTLPNGRLIPVALPGGVSPHSVLIQGNTRLYFAFAEGTAFLGTAIVIPEFDRLAGYVGGLDVFLPFQGEGGVRGAAGLFSSTLPGQSGLAVFVDVGPVLSATSPKALTAAVSRAPAAKSAAQGQALAFRTQSTLSSSQALKFNRFVRDLGASGKRLSIERF